MDPTEPSSNALTMTRNDLNVPQCPEIDSKKELDEWIQLSKERGDYIEENSENDPFQSSSSNEENLLEDEEEQTMGGLEEAEAKLLKFITSSQDSSKVQSAQQMLQRVQLKKLYLDKRIRSRSSSISSASSTPMMSRNSVGPKELSDKLQALAQEESPPPPRSSLGASGRNFMRRSSFVGKNIDLPELTGGTLWTGKALNETSSLHFSLRVGIRKGPRFMGRISIGETEFRVKGMVEEMTIRFESENENQITGEANVEGWIMKGEWKEEGGMSGTFTCEKEMPQWEREAKEVKEKIRKEEEEKKRLEEEKRAAEEFDRLAREEEEELERKRQEEERVRQERERKREEEEKRERERIEREKEKEREKEIMRQREAERKKNEEAREREREEAARREEEEQRIKEEELRKREEDIKIQEQLILQRQLELQQKEERWQEGEAHQKTEEEKLKQKEEELERREALLRASEEELRKRQRVLEESSENNSTEQKDAEVAEEEKRKAEVKWRKMEVELRGERQKLRELQKIQQKKLEEIEQEKERLEESEKRLKAQIKRNRISAQPVTAKTPEKSEPEILPQPPKKTKKEAQLLNEVTHWRQEYHLQSQKNKEVMSEAEKQKMEVENLKKEKKDLLYTLKSLKKARLKEAGMDVEDSSDLSTLKPNHRSFDFPRHHEHLPRPTHRSLDERGRKKTLDRADGSSLDYPLKVTTMRLSPPPRTDSAKPLNELNRSHNKSEPFLPMLTSIQQKQKVGSNRSLSSLT